MFESLMMIATDSGEKLTHTRTGRDKHLSGKVLARPACACAINRCNSSGNCQVFTCARFSVNSIAQRNGLYLYEK